MENNICKKCGKGEVSLEKLEDLSKESDELVTYTWCFLCTNCDLCEPADDEEAEIKVGVTFKRAPKLGTKPVTSV